MRIGEFYRDGNFGLSIEVFPPKNAQGDETLHRTLDRLSAYRPAFISCTYGAGGSTRQRTVEICQEIQEKYNLPSTAHLTCVGSTRDEILEWLQSTFDVGIKNIMALRGDPPKGQDKFEAVEGGLRYGNELVTLIREHFPEAGIGVAGYPETHQEAPSSDVDLENLKRKVDAGADAVYTQMFYTNKNFFEFRERYEKAGIEVPLIPGIMPITSFSKIKKIASMCGAIIPDDLAGRLEAAQDDKETQFNIGLEHAIDQCKELVKEGIPGFHFYVLNRSRACEEILNSLGMEPTPQADCA